MRLEVDKDGFGGDEFSLFRWRCGEDMEWIGGIHDSGITMGAESRWERELVYDIDGRRFMLTVLVVVGGHGEVRRCCLQQKDEVLRCGDLPLHE